MWVKNPLPPPENEREAAAPPPRARSPKVRYRIAWSDEPGKVGWRLIVEPVETPGEERAS